MASKVLVAGDASGGGRSTARALWLSMGGLVALALVGWVAATSLAISAGAFSVRLEVAPDLPIGIAASIAIPVGVGLILYARLSAVREWALALDPRMVFAVQHARLLGVAFLFAWAWGELPASFAGPAAFGDIATGLAAYGISATLLHGPLAARRFWGFTALGLGDFVLAIVLGAALQPAALDEWPLAFFPGLAVPFFAIVHLVTIAQYRQGVIRTR